MSLITLANKYLIKNQGSMTRIHIVTDGDLYERKTF